MAEHTKKFGLNLIVGSGEADILERCLKSVQGINFDEVVITHATRMRDEEVVRVAERYATKVAFFEWCDDFSKARNYSFSQSEARHILWLDSDDVVKESEHAKINALIERLPEIDVVLMDYVYSHDDKDRPVLVLPRERLVRNTPDIRWHDPIHEYLNMDGSMRISRVDIKIDHYRNRPYDPKRNLTLLKQEYDTGKASARIAFYYGKELADVGKWDEAVPVLEKFVAKGDGFVDNLTVGCIRLANHYMRKRDSESARNYAMLGIRYNGIYAENHVVLGMIAEQEGREDEAVTYYKEALTKTLSGGMSQLVDYYGYIPSMKLASIMLKKGHLEEALKYADVAIERKPESKDAVALKAEIEKRIRSGIGGQTLERRDIDEMGNFLRNRDLILEVLQNNGLHADVRLRKHRETSVAWLLPNDDASNPSTRLRRLIIDEKLRQKKVKSRRVVGYQNMPRDEVVKTVGDANIVVFTSFGPVELELMRTMKEGNRKICFDHCEAIFGFPFEDECMHEADAILCCSTKLEEMTRDRGFLHTVVLKDSIEERDPRKPHQYLE